MMSSQFETPSGRDPAGYSSRTVMGLLGNMILIPVKAFIYGMEMLVRAMQGMQSVTDRSLAVMSGEDGTNSAGGKATPTPAGAVNTEQALPFSGTAVGTNPPDIQSVRTHETIGKENLKMPDTNLNDDTLKLVRYKILFVRREYEVAFPENEELVPDNMTESAFTAWKIAEFIQGLETEEVPAKWLAKNYPRDYPKSDDGKHDKHYVKKLPEGDKKFLRVYFEVLQRYAREKLKYEEDQLEALRGIKDAIEKQHK